MDSRLASMETRNVEIWIRDHLHLTRYTLAPASSDASFRRYFRLTDPDGATRIIMDAPPEKENTRNFVRIAHRFHALGLHVPAVLAEDHDQGFLLLSDLGSTPYLSMLDTRSADRLYHDACSALLRLQQGSFAAQDCDHFLPHYDAAILRRELEIFREWYLGRHLGLSFTVTDRAIWDRLCDFLTTEALAQPRVWVHRDFHSRNLMVMAGTGNPGVLDFQDALFGPVTYDLASLLKDCYIAWPRARVEGWVKEYLQRARASGIPVGDDDAGFLRSFDLTATQRHLKAVGIFARLNHRDGKPGYLGDIPRTLNYVHEVCALYPDPALAGLKDLLRACAHDMPPSP